MRLAQKSQRMYGQRPSLVKTALGLLRPVERHRNHQHFDRSLICKLSDSLGQHPAHSMAAGCSPSYLSAWMAAFMRPS